MEKNNDIFRVALIGPESTGKSTLANGLAQYYKTVSTHEVAREYIAQLNRDYTLDDIINISKQQVALEQNMLAKANRVLFCDTELIINKVWAEDVFKTCPDWIEANIKHNQHDLYLLTSPDLPWEEDPVRENPDRRAYLFEWYQKELKSIQATHVVISGEGDQRLENCIMAVDKFLKSVSK